MAYIRSDGTLVQGTKPRLTDPIMKATRAFGRLSLQWKTVAIVVVALSCRHWLRPNPFANGKIPASDFKPDEHWKRIKEDDLFMRTMSEPLGKSTHRKGQKERMKHLVESKDPHGFTIMLGRVDFGGPDGHVAETAGDWSDMKYVQGTRCSTTQSALTAYFCGAKVAENQDVGLGEKRKPYNYGVESFMDFLTCRYEEGKQRDTHKRSVYRLGIGCRDSLAGYSHAFNIIAQPDGTFLWLQSFIGHYSLPQWMDKTDLDGTPHGHLTFDQLQVKLRQVIRLMNIYSWTAQANKDYFELFNVDKNEASLKKNSRRHSSLNWNPDHRLELFVWDEACEYPLPGELQNDTQNGQQETPRETSQYFDLSDGCVVKSLMNQFPFGTKDLSFLFEDDTKGDEETFPSNP